MRSIANIIQSHMKGSQDSSLKTEKETLATYASVKVSMLDGRAIGCLTPTP